MAAFCKAIGGLTVLQLSYSTDGYSLSADKVKPCHRLPGWEGTLMLPDGSDSDISQLLLLLRDLQSAPGGAEPCIVAHCTVHHSSKKIEWSDHRSRDLFVFGLKVALHTLVHNGPVLDEPAPCWPV